MVSSLAVRLVIQGLPLSCMSMQPEDVFFTGVVPGGNRRSIHVVVRRVGIMEEPFERNHCP